MSTPVQSANIAVAQARKGYEDALPETISAFQKTLSAAFDQLITITVKQQTKITKEMDPAERGVLKFNVTQAIQSGAQAVEPRIRALELDDLARARKDSSSRISAISPDKILSPLLDVAVQLLRDAGYDTSSIAAGNSLRALDLDYSADHASRRLDAYIDAYYLAVAALAAVVRRTEENEAAALWDDAG